MEATFGAALNYRAHFFFVVARINLYYSEPTLQSSLHNSTTSGGAEPSHTIVLFSVRANLAKESLTKFWLRLTRIIRIVSQRPQVFDLRHQRSIDTLTPLPSTGLLNNCSGLWICYENYMSTN